MTNQTELVLDVNVEELEQKIAPESTAAVLD